MKAENKILILDFGSQFTQLIARRIREIGVYSEILPYNTQNEKIKKLQPKAVILSGGPSSVSEHKSPDIPDIVFELSIPVLGICYGQQIICKKFGGSVSFNTKNREFGKANLKILKQNPILDNIWKDKQEQPQVWMSHGDHIDSLPPNFEVLASSSGTDYAIISHTTRPIYGVQFHPEVVHTPKGKDFLENFIIKIANCKKDWQMENFAKNKIAEIKNSIKNNKIICAISGGVDSTVVASLLSKAVGKNLYCIFVDNGLLRKNEAQEVENLITQNFNLNFIKIDASEIFLQALKNITDPEQKRKIIGHKFIEIFQREIKKIGNIKYLAQGTIYPDVIESLSDGGNKKTIIKSHHNVGGLPEDMGGLQLIEPLKMLFKDEVRKLGLELAIPNQILTRHPFPGPGLAIRIVGEVTKTKCDILREADMIYISEMKKWNIYDKVWQAYAALLPIRSVGVMGDARTYEQCCMLRAVTSIDGMTADFAQLPYDFLGHVSRKIVNQVEGINRILYDITSKPPATIEME